MIHAIKERRRRSSPSGESGSLLSPAEQLLARVLLQQMLAFADYLGGHGSILLAAATRGQAQHGDAQKREQYNGRRLQCRRYQ